MDGQQKEQIGRSYLEVELIKQDLEVANPYRDKGIDLIIFSDIEDQPFRALPVQVTSRAGKGLASGRSTLTAGSSWHTFGIFAITHASSSCGMRRRAVFFRIKYGRHHPGARVADTLGQMYLNG